MKTLFWMKRPHDGHGVHAADSTVQEVVPTKRQNILFSATFPPRVERLAEEFLLWPTRIEVTPESTPVATVTQYKLPLPNLRTKIAFIEWYVREARGRPAVDFTRRKRKRRTSSFLTAHLKKASEPCIATRSKCTHQCDAEFRTGEVQILIATDVASRGIDVPETQWSSTHPYPATPTTTSPNWAHRSGLREGRL